MSGPTNTDSRRLRVATWNVHKFIGRNGRRNPDASLQAIAEFDADLIALQEIDGRRSRSGETEAFASLRALTGFNRLEARTIRTAAGDYGHVLLSRWPFDDFRLLKLGVPGRENRLAITATLETPHAPVRVVAAHLGLSARERRHQIARIRDHLRATDLAAAVVIGDFNDWRRNCFAQRTLCPPFGAAASERSFPARLPCLPLDRIWCREPLVPTASRVVRACRDLSDHLPVVAELEFLAEAAGNARPNGPAGATPAATGVQSA